MEFVLRQRAHFQRTTNDKRYQMKLYEDQQYGKQLIVNSLRSGKRHPIFAAPTGYGKTVLMCNMVAGAIKKNKRVWVIVDSIELVNQTRNTLIKHGIDSAVIQGQHEDTDYRAPVQVVMAQTITRRWKILDENKHWLPDLAFADEVHIQHKAIRELIGMMPEIYLIGFTATPTSKGLGLVFDDLIVPSTTLELIEKGRLVPVKTYSCYTPDTKGWRTNAKGDFAEKVVEQELNTQEIRGDIVDNWKKLGENRKTIVFAATIQHSVDIKNEFIQAGVGACQIDGYTDKDLRAELIQEFRDNKITVLVSVMALIKGFDVVDIGCVCACRPSKSLSYHVQSNGRGSRQNDTYEDLILLDFAGNTARMGFFHEYDPKSHGLDMGDKGNASDRLPEDEPLPKECTVCHFMKPPKVYKCPNCSHEPKKKVNIEVTPGELKLLTPTQRKHVKNSTPESLQRFYSGLIGYQQYKNYKPGYAYYKFKEKFGIEPKHLKAVPGDFNVGDVAGYIHYLNIKAGFAAKRKG